MHFGGLSNDFQGPLSGVVLQFSDFEMNFLEMHDLGFCMGPERLQIDQGIHCRLRERRSVELLLATTSFKIIVTFCTCDVRCGRQTRWRMTLTL